MPQVQAPEIRQIEQLDLTQLPPLDTPEFESAVTSRLLIDALSMLEALDAMLSDADVRYNHGLCLSELGRPAEAITLRERALALNPAHKDAAIALGVAHAKLEHFDATTEVQGRFTDLLPARDSQDGAQGQLH